VVAAIVSAADERLGALARVWAGMARLRGVGSVSAIFERATAEVCHSCGFDRSVLFRVEGDHLVPQSVCFQADPEAAAALLEAGRREPLELGRMPAEMEMIRRRTPMLVLSRQQGPDRVEPFGPAPGECPYVAAPILPEGRVIGFLHADRHLHRHVDAFDRDELSAFAEGFGFAFHRTLLLERLRSYREQVAQMVSSSEQLMSELCDTDIEVARLREESSATIRRSASGLAAPSSRSAARLTPRETEVIALIAAGESNAGIAARLVVSEGTVKSHVKHILRKLRAANRAEAVSHYLRVSGLEDAS
jgi:DNA-binding CsgD family transcriptional regulator